MIDHKFTRIQTKNLLAKGLKEAWPQATFKVRIKDDSLCVEWEDGPPESEVEPIVNQFSAGSFDGMIDLYEYDPGSVHLCGAAGHGELQTWRWTSVRRTLSHACKQSIIDGFEANWGYPYNECSSADRHWLGEAEKPVALTRHPKQPSPTLDSIFYVGLGQKLETLFAARESTSIESYLVPKLSISRNALRI